MVIFLYNLSMFCLDTTLLGPLNRLIIEDITKLETTKNGLKAASKYVMTSFFKK